jgi:hypothetical protein
MLYIAGGSSERLTVVRPLIDACLAAGVSITLDWTRLPEWDDPQQQTHEFYRMRARQDLDALARAQLFWLVVPEQKSEGSAAELGYALAFEELGHDIIISGTTGTIGARNIFVLLADRIFTEHKEALAFVISVWGKR